ncbi:MAG: ABC transporter ATP-binding protein [Aliivibrio sp.]|uniref:ABC transporter ATP-binding protein n=1 Tax=Aliivibrio sp. TaxID=1872443 RepID=UPI001A4D13DF|nr:ABC transporter ATP-binding protein [Aliivibrio sp.]
MASLTINNLSKSYGKTEVLKAINLHIPDKSFVSFLGPSGCGKSTLLRCIAGLEEINSGEISTGYHAISHLPPAQRNIAMVFQSYALYPHMTVAQNIGYCLKLAKQSKSDIKQRVIAVAKALELEPYLSRKPSQLSGGQRQRVAIGRAIVREPEVFLFDEPLSNLDASMRVTMRMEIARLHQELDTTMVYVTHDQIEAMTLSDIVVVLQDGIIEQTATPLELYYQPANLFVATFIGSPTMNLLSCTVESISDTLITVIEHYSKTKTSVPVLPDHRCAIGDTLTLGIRPEHLIVETSPQDNTLQGTIGVLERLGGNAMLYVKTGQNTPLTISAENLIACQSGQEIHIRLSGEDCYLFTDNDNAIPRPFPAQQFLKEIA